MNELTETLLVRGADGHWYVSSLVVADKFEKRHDHVLEAIRNLDCSSGFRAPNFRDSSYITEQNKSQPCVLMRRDGFMFLAMGFTGPKAAYWKERLIEDFNAKEALIQDLLTDRQTPTSVLERCIDTLANAQASMFTTVAGIGHVLVQHDQHFTRLDSAVDDLNRKWESRNKRRVITPRDKRRHWEAIVQRGNGIPACPCCFRPLSQDQVEYDHFHDNSRASFGETWPLHRECHRKLTLGQTDRTEVFAQFNAYQDWCKRHLPDPEAPSIPQLTLL